MADETPQVTEDSRSRVGLVLAAVAAIALLLFIFQNTDDAAVEFLWFDFTFPLYLLIFITIGLTVIISILVAWILNRRSKRS